MSILPNNSEIRFETSTLCNHNCIFCRNNVLKRKHTIMKLETFKLLLDKIMKKTNQYDTVSFAGIGEPLKDPGLEVKIHYTRTKYSHVHIPMVTNGSLLTPEKFLALQDAGVDIIRISFHGGTEDIYSKVHQVNDFQKVKNYLDEILAKKLNLYTRIALSFAVVEGVSERTIDQWLELWNGKEGVWLAEIWRVHNWVNSFHFRNVQEERMNTCGRVFKAPLQIQVDGTVNMCCFDYDGKLLLGDLKTQSLEEIFTGSSFQKIAKCHVTGNFEGSNLICRSCDQRNKDKSEALIFSSRFGDKNERITKTSTSYKPII